MSTAVYEIITERIIAELEKGNIPWEKPWTGIRTGAYSRSTGRPYSILNQLILTKPGEYLTFKQITEAGGIIRKGEKSQIVVFWKMMRVTEKNKDDKPVDKIIPLLRYYHVFHIDQCENVKPRFTQEELLPANPIAEAESILTDYSRRSGCTIINEKQDRAFYRPSTDTIHLPLREQFSRIEEYYSTAFHEAIHSTGHKTRLDRLSKTAHFGNEDYSKEELVAEIGAAITMNELGIETQGSFRNSTAYVQSWLRALKNDHRLIVTAAGKAEKAVRLLLNLESEKADPVEIAA